MVAKICNTQSVPPTVLDSWDPSWDGILLHIGRVVNHRKAILAEIPTNIFHLLRKRIESDLYRAGDAHRSQIQEENAADVPRQSFGRRRFIDDGVALLALGSG